MCVSMHPTRLLLRMALGGTVFAGLASPVLVPGVLPGVNDLGPIPILLPLVLIRRVVTLRVPLTEKCDVQVLTITGKPTLVMTVYPLPRRLIRPPVRPNGALF